MSYFNSIGLDAGQSVNAVVHFGQFTNDDVNYTLSACIFAPSAPETPINCAGTFGFNPHMNTTAASGSENSDSENVTKSGEADNTNNSDTISGATNNSANSDTTSNGTEPSSGGTPTKDSEGFKLLDSGSWNGTSSLNYQGGQVMHFQVKNVNVLGTTLTIKSNLGGKKSSLVLPHQTVDLRFDCFGNEPMGWTFDISSESDAFIVAWALYSSWVIGDLPNK